MSRNEFMRPLQWWWLSVRRRSSSGAPLVTLCAIATLLLTAVLVPIAAVSQSVAAQQSGSGVLTQIDVTSGDGDSDSASGPALTTSARSAIAALPGVRSVLADLSVGVYSGGEGTWSTTLHTVNPANLPTDLDPNVATTLEGNQVIVPATIDSVDLAKLVGAELAIEYTQATGENEGELRELALTPVATYDPSWQGYGPSAMLGSERQVATLLAARQNLDLDTYLNKNGVPAVIVFAKDENSVTTVTEALRTSGYDARPQRDSLGELPGIISVFPTLFIVIALAVIGLLSTLVLTVVRNAVERRSSEFGLLRIRGWSISDVRSLILIDVGAGSLIGATLGVLAGAALGTLLAGALEQSGLSAGELAAGAASTSGGGMPYLSTALALALVALAIGPAVLAVAVGLVASRRALRKDPYLTLVRSG